MGRLSTTLSSEEWEQYRPIVEEILLENSMTTEQCCAYLLKYCELNVSPAQLRYRVSKWGIRRNIKRKESEQAFRSGLLEQQPGKWTQREQKRHDRMWRTIKKEKLDMVRSVKAPMPVAAIGQIDARAVGQMMNIQPNYHPATIRTPGYHPVGVGAPRAQEYGPNTERVGTVALRPNFVPIASSGGASTDIYREVIAKLRGEFEIDNAWRFEYIDTEGDFDTQDCMMLSQPPPGHARTSQLMKLIQTMDKRDPNADFNNFIKVAPLHPKYVGKENWNIEFVRLFISTAFDIANKNLLSPCFQQTYLKRLLERFPDFFALLDWILEVYPGSTGTLRKFALGYAMRNVTDPGLVDIKRLMPSNFDTFLTDIRADFPYYMVAINGKAGRYKAQDAREEIVINKILRDGKTWFLEALFENCMLPTPDPEALLKAIITTPKFLTLETIPKIWWLKGLGLNLASLCQYSDGNPEYKGWDLGTKLFLLASQLHQKILMRDLQSQLSPGAKLLLHGQKITIRNSRQKNEWDTTLSLDDVISLTKYLLENCVVDYEKALINAILPISYMSKIPSTDLLRIGPIIFNRNKNSKSKSGKFGPSLHPKCSFKAIEHLQQKNVNINTIWVDGMGKPYNPLMLALVGRRRGMVISFLLQQGANVDIGCDFFIKKSNSVPSIPLYEALRSRIQENIGLILERQPRIKNPAFCLHIAYINGPKIHEGKEWDKWEMNILKPLGEVIESQRPHLGEQIISQYETVRRLLTEGCNIYKSEEIVFSNLANEEGRSHSQELEQFSRALVDQLAGVIEAKKPDAFEEILSSLNHDVGAKKAALAQVLQVLKINTTRNKGFLYTYTQHKLNPRAAHQQAMVFTLWEHFLEHQILPSGELLEAMIVPIFWSIVWDGLPEPDAPVAPTQHQQCLRKIMSRITGHELSLENSLKAASRYQATHFIHTLGRPFGPWHEACFRRGVEAAIRFGWDLTTKISDTDTSTILHFAIATSVKAAKLLLDHDQGLHTKMTKEARANLLILAAFYGRLDILKILIKGQDGRFVNQTSCLQEFTFFSDYRTPSISNTGRRPPNQFPIHKMIRGTTTALHVASFQGRRAMVEMLIERGADVNMQVPMMKAVRSDKEPGRVEEVPKPLEQNRVYTALSLAANRGQAEIVDLLLKHKPECLRITAQVAYSCGHVEIAHKIEKAYSLSTSCRDIEIT